MGFRCCRNNKSLHISTGLVQRQHAIAGKSICMEQRAYCQFRTRAVRISLEFVCNMIAACSRSNSMMMRQRTHQPRQRRGDESVHDHAPPSRGALGSCWIPVSAVQQMDRCFSCSRKFSRCSGSSASGLCAELGDPVSGMSRLGVEEKGRR